MIIDFKNKLEKLKQNTIDSERFVERLKSKTGTKNRIKLASLQKVIIFYNLMISIATFKANWA